MYALVTLPVLTFLAFQAADGPDGIVSDLVPRPHAVEPAPGAFGGDMRLWTFVLRAPDKTTADRLGARLEDVQARLGLADPAHIAEYPAESFALIVAGGDTLPDPPAWDLPEEARAEGYVLRISDAGIAVSAAEERGLFYGMMTLEQLLTARSIEALPGMTIRDWPALPMRGYHEDYGRDQLPTIQDHKRMVRILAQHKMNTHFWFIEPNHFLYAFDPELGKEYDRFAFDEIREIVAYAKEYYVTVVPVVELLAHMEYTLNNPKYAALAETLGSGTLCPTSDEAFQLVKKMVDEIAPAFEGPYFHCGLDESAVVGQGQSADAVKAKGIEQVYADYYTRLDDLVKSHGKTMMMYADIVLNHPHVMDLLPKDIVMMYWNYGDAAHYPDFDKLVASGFKTVSLSGLWDWVNLYPVYGYAVKNIEHLAVQTKQLGSPGHFVSDWGDWNLGAAGANLSELNLFGAIYCGAQGWNPGPLPLEAFCPAFAVQLFGLASKDAAEAFRLLALCQGDTLDWNRRARFMFHGDPKEQVPAMGRASEAELTYWKQLESSAHTAHLYLKKSVVRLNPEYLRSYDLAARMLEFAADLALECRATAEAEQQPDFDRAAHAAAYDALLARQRDLWAEYREVYAATNRPINLQYLVTAWDQSQRALADYADALHGESQQ